MARTLPATSAEQESYCCSLTVWSWALQLGTCWSPARQPWDTGDPLPLRAISILVGKQREQSMDFQAQSPVSAWREEPAVLCCAVLWIAFPDAQRSCAAFWRLERWVRVGANKGPGCVLPQSSSLHRLRVIWLILSMNICQFFLLHLLDLLGIMCLKIKFDDLLFSSPSSTL